MVILDKENRPNDVIRLDVNAHKGMSDMCIVIVTLTLPYNKTSYEQRKENNKIRRITDGEGPYDFVYNGIPKEHCVLKGKKACVHCGAKRFQFEFATFCCMDGKTKLAYSSIPEELLELFTSRNKLGKTFRHMI
uniref:Uncharacterized protein n=1 Tax=Lactuca sativa TaxID=4236 RepID=A0A9R1X405_LACSA|nr:hypothetical protein LSAT_V11C700345520 [Lactuca sativa]